MKRSLLIALLCASAAVSNAQSTVNINADQNTYIITYGGGGGKNSFLKFDISGIPSGAIIDSVKFRCYVFNSQPVWDGDAQFVRYNNQAWVETDSTQDMWNTALYTDTVTALSGFGNAIGFYDSPDISSLFNVDYLATNTYFSLVLIDPDDPTVMPMLPGATYSNTDSMLVGNIFNDRIGFRPRLYANPNQRPYLIVSYTLPGASVEENKANKTNLSISPNPNHGMFNVAINSLSHESTVDVINELGEVIRTFKIGANQNLQSIPVDITNLADGLYFVRLYNKDLNLIQKTIKN